MWMHRYPQKGPFDIILFFPGLIVEYNVAILTIQYIFPMLFCQSLIHLQPEHQNRYLMKIKIRHIVQQHLGIYLQYKQVYFLKA